MNTSNDTTRYAVCRRTRRSHVTIIAPPDKGISRRDQGDRQQDAGEKREPQDGQSGSFHGVTPKSRMFEKAPPPHGRPPFTNVILTQGNRHAKKKTAKNRKFFVMCEISGCQLGPFDFCLLLYFITRTRTMSTIPLDTICETLRE